MALFLPSKKRDRKSTVNIPWRDFAVLAWKNAPRKWHSPMQLLVSNQNSLMRDVWGPSLDGSQSQCQTERG